MSKSYFKGYSNIFQPPPGEIGEIPGTKHQIPNFKVVGAGEENNDEL